MVTKITKKKPSVSRSALIHGLQKFRGMRLDKDALEKAIPLEQAELIESLRAVDPDNDGVIWDKDDVNKGTAFVQQNDGSLVWKTTDIIEWLRKGENKKMWLACSSRIFDVNKFEAEIANGNIDKKLVKRFQTTTDPAKPFIRFGKAKKESK